MDTTLAPSRAGLVAPRVALALILGFWTFYFVLNTVRAGVMEFPDQGELLGRRGVVTLAGILLTLVLAEVLRRAPSRTLTLRILAAFLACMPFATLFGAFNYVAFYVYRPVDRTPVDRTPAAPVPTGPMEREEKSAAMMIADNAVTWYFFFVSWAALYLALGYAAEKVAAERRAADFRDAAQAAELRALRYQVNPHFLFNTLNSLSSLVLTGQADKAERMIINLSTFFRTSLSGEPAEDVVLAEELRLQRLYLDIEAVRFPERLIVEVAAPPDLGDACVPGLILQPIVENAIKYGVSRARRPVTLTICAEAVGDRLVLSVEDDGDAAPAAANEAESHGVGLINVRQRLAARFGAAGIAHWGPRPGGGFAVTLMMPLVRHGC